MTVPASEAVITPSVSGTYDVRVVLTNDGAIRTATETRRVDVNGDVQIFAVIWNISFTSNDILNTFDIDFV